MLKIMFLLIVSFLISLSIVSNVSYAVPADPTPIKLNQPNGSMFLAMQIGDEKEHYLETIEGYTILQDKNNWWVYAKSEKGILTSSNTRVGISDPKLLGIEVHVRPTNNPKISITKTFETSSKDKEILSKEFTPFLSSQNPIRGGEEIVVIPIQFTDVKAKSFPAFTHSGTKEWYSGNGNFLNNVLSRTINLTFVSSATLKFWTWYEIESGYDFGYVEISTDGGSTWTQKLNFTGTQNTWTQKAIDLTSYSGSIIQLRFRYYTDWLISKTGWFIDDTNISEINFVDDVESGNVGWSASGWSVSDASIHPSSYNQKFYYNLLFNTTTGVNSMYNYYKEASYNQLLINGTILDWVTSNYTLAYYGADTGPNDSDPSTTDDGYTSIYELTREAVRLADPYIDFSKYDKNNDGFVDHVIIIFAGNAQSSSGVSTDIWPHRWYVVPSESVDGVKVSSYTMNAETSPLGTFAHEFGHDIGLPDLYDTDYSSQGVGSWDLMSGGSWLNTGNTPAHLSAWSKYYLGWVIPIDVNVSMNSVSQTIQQAETTNTSIYRLLFDEMGIGEYFLVENREKVGYDGYLPGSGLLIWHIDETVSGNWNDTHRKVDLEEADGNDNPTQSTDPWYNNVAGFTSSSNPNSNSYGGSATGVSVTNIGSAGVSMSAKFNVGTIPPSPPALNDLSPFTKSNVTLSWSLFNDNAEGGAGNWNLNGFSLNSTRYHSPSNSYYSGRGNNLARTMTLINPINLTGISNPMLSFWTYYQTEWNYDFAYVKISTDGVTWSTLATFNGFQPFWEITTYNLSLYSGQQIYIQFNYTTDPSISYEGFYVDDISILNGSQPLDFNSYNVYRYTSPINNTNINAATLVVSGLSSTLTTDTPPSDGVWYYVVASIDNLGNKGLSTNKQIIKDTVPPTTTLQIPSNNSFISNNRQNINATISDSGSGINYSSIIMKVDGIYVATLVITPNSVNYIPYTPFSNLTEGKHNVSLAITDNVSNGMTSIWYFTVDTIYPSVISYIPSDGSYVQGTSNQTFTVNYTEMNLDYIQFYWNETWPFNVSSLPINLTGCLSGIYQTCSHNLDLSKYSENDKIVFYFGVFDKTGKSSYLMNSQGQPYSVLIHRTPPYYSSVSQYPMENPVYGTGVQLNSSWADIAGVSRVLLESNYTGTWRNYTTQNQSSTYYYIIPSSYLNAGKVVSWRFIANDSLDNWNISMPYQNFTVQRAPTSINILLDGTEDNKTYEKGQLANITAIVNVTGKPLVIEANFSGSSVQIGSGTTAITNITNTGNLILGTYNITAYFVNDENYTQSSLTRYLTIQDTTPPTISSSIIVPTIAKPNSNITLITTITDNDIVSYAYVTGYNSSWYPVYQSQNLTNLGNSWFLIFNISNVSTGTHYFNISAVDTTGNNRTTWADNITVNQTSGATNTFVNTSISTVSNQTTIDATQTTNTSLEIKTNQSVSNASVSIVTYTENPGTANVGIPALNKYLEITASSDLNTSLSWVIIKVYYNDSDILSGYSENNLRIYYQNPDGTWTAYDGNLMIGGVNTTANYVWANTTHFSIYGIFIKPTCSDGIQNQGETGIDCGGACSACYSPPPPSPAEGGGAGGGGGGGAAPTEAPKKITTTNITNETTLPLVPTPLIEENKTTPTNITENITKPTPTPAGIPTGFAVLVPYFSNPITLSVIIIMIAICIMYWKKLFIFKKTPKPKK